MTSMSSVRNLLAALGLSLGLAAFGSHAAEGAAHHHEHGAAPAKPVLNDGTKWPTDQALRSGMGRIRAAMEASLHEIHAGKLSNARYGKLAKSVSAEVEGIVAECKLDPQADAQLHLIIAALLEGADAMQGKAKTAGRQTGAVAVLDALDQHATNFDHADWKPLSH